MVQIVFESSSFRRWSLASAIAAMLDGEQLLSSLSTFCFKGSDLSRCPGDLF